MNRASFCKVIFCQRKTMTFVKFCKADSFLRMHFTGERVTSEDFSEYETYYTSLLTDLSKKKEKVKLLIDMRNMTTDVEAMVVVKQAALIKNTRDLAEAVFQHVIVLGDSRAFKLAVKLLLTMVSPSAPMIITDDEGLAQELWNSDEKVYKNVTYMWKTQ